MEVTINAGAIPAKGRFAGNLAMIIYTFITLCRNGDTSCRNGIFAVRTGAGGW